MESLMKRNLSFNQLSGSIPSSIGALTKLNNLDLSANQLSGAIPSSIGSLVKLQHLILSKNKLTSWVPPSITSLTSLNRLLLANNHLVGVIPSSIGSLTGLSELDLSGNRFTGTIPSSIASLKRLTALELSDNQLEGVVDPKLFSIRCSVNISNNYLIPSNSMPNKWRKSNAFQSPSQILERKELPDTPSDEECNFLPQGLIEVLELEHVTEEHTATLSKLLRSKKVPKSLNEWVEQGLPIGFPDNRVWPVVTHALKQMPAKVEEAMKLHTGVSQRIQDLRSELSRLEAQQSLWYGWQGPIKRLHSHSVDMLSMAEQLCANEQKFSALAMRQLATHTLPPSDEEVEDVFQDTGVMNPYAWQVILRSAGLSARSASRLRDDIDDVLVNEADLSSLSDTERWDVRYLQQMVQCKSVPFVHPFHERYAQNRRLDSGTPAEHQSEHSCVVCDCETPQQLANLVKEMRSPLAKLDLTKFLINGPRLIMMTKQELQNTFSVSKKDISLLAKAHRALKSKHVVIRLSSED